jgi:hypothetical protein
MGGKADGAELVKDRSFQSLLAKMDADADAAERLWKKQLASPDWAVFPSGFVAQYKEDGASMVRSQKNFNLEWNKVVAGRGDVKKLIAAYDVYSGDLEALVENNLRFEALLGLNAAAMALAWIGIFKLMYDNGIARLTRLEQELKALQAELDKAQGEVQKVEWKRRLNVLVSVVTLVAAPEAHLAKVLLAAGGITVHVVIDNVLGNSTAKGTVAFVVGDGVEFIKQLEEAEKKFAGAAAAVVTFKFDSDELEEVEEVLERVRTRLERTEEAIENTLAFLRPMVPKLKNIDVSIRALSAAADKALSRSYDAAMNYDAIRKSMKTAL